MLNLGGFKTPRPLWHDGWLSVSYKIYINMDMEAQNRIDIYPERKMTIQLWQKCRTIPVRPM